MNPSRDRVARSARTPSPRSAATLVGADPAPEPWTQQLDRIAQRFAASAANGTPRYTQLRNTVATLVSENLLATGTQLPPEQRLAAALGISLGTVQKALRRLTDEGFIVREHGRGTFVAAPRRPVQELWHYRFVDPRTGELMPVYSKLLGRRLIKQPDALAGRLGPDRAGYVEIERRVDIGGKLACHSRMFLGASRFSGLLDLPPSVFENVNLKQVLAQSFSAPTIAASQHLRVERISPAVAAALGLPRSSVGMVRAVVAYSHGRLPISFQQIFVPQSPYALDVTSHDARGSVRLAS